VEGVTIPSVHSSGVLFVRFAIEDIFLSPSVVGGAPGLEPTTIASPRCIHRHCAPISVFLLANSLEQSLTNCLSDSSRLPEQACISITSSKLSISPNRSQSGQAPSASSKRSLWMSQVWIVISFLTIKPTFAIPNKLPRSVSGVFPNSVAFRVVEQFTNK
jgi:hypothetical protein